MLKQLKLYYVFVSLPFAMLILGSLVFFDGIKSTITRNPHPQINYTIFVIILVGGIVVLLNARRLMREARALVEFSGAIHAKTDLNTLREMAEKYTGDIACLLQMIATSGDRSISHQEQAALEHELANVNSRLNRRNALPQYLTGLLVGMGLLGTFIGLLATLGDITVLITSFADLDMKTVDPIKVFGLMIDRMRAPMQSMAIAFSASMFGLLGSIILGLMMVGIRRLQGDIFSVLTSEIARHIEIALSFESISFRGGEGVAGEIAAGDVSTKILLRIEERLAEAARIRQRALSTEIDDFKKQRADMLRALDEQTESNKNFRTELQQLGSQLGAIFNFLENGNSDISDQLSELTVQVAGGTKETHKLLSMQVDEQKGLRDTLDSYNIEERLTEAVRVQQRALTSEIEDFKKQRSDMLRTLADQTEASNSFSGELKQIGSHLATISDAMEKGNGNISTQLSELTVQMAGAVKESQKLLAMQVDEQKGLRDTLDSYNIEERLTEASRVQQRALTSEIEDFQKQRSDMLHTLAEQTEASNNFRNELQQLGRQLDAICNVMEKGNGEMATQISELMIRMAADAGETHKLLAMQVGEREA